MFEQQAAWAALNSKASYPAAGTEFCLGFIADQDEASHIEEKKWQSYLAYATLKFRGDNGDQSYTLEMKGEALAVSDIGDKSNRGAEYSALEIFDGKLLTFCDRTGNVDELVLSQDPEGKTVVTVEHLVGADGNRVSIRMGDGSKDKPLKIE